MVKKISMLALAGLIALPAVAAASGGANANDLERKIEELSMQLDQLKAQMAENKGAGSGDLTDLENAVSDLEDRSDAWDLAARFKFYGDFRSRLDYYRASYTDNYVGKSNTLWTNRFRLNMRVKATENVEFKARLAMYKAWGMQSTPAGVNNNTPMWDGTSTRTPDDSALRVDRAFINWNNIGGAPIWFSIGRRPTTDGPPSQIRLGADERMATPVIFMDWPFDGISVGYAYRWGSEAMGTGRVRFCYGRGFEDGMSTTELQNNTSADDMDFAGISWDIMKVGNRFINFQSFAAFNVMNRPTFEDPLYEMGMEQMMPQDSIGNIYHTSAVYLDKVSDFNYFLVGGWSHADPNDNGMFNDIIGMSMGMTGPNTDNQDGYTVYVGGRYDIDSLGLKLGAEYNYGSEYWLAMNPGHDDMYSAKLAARGNVYEIYGIYDLPTGEAISKYAKTFIRLGYQYYDYSYSGSFDWNFKPYDLDDSMDVQMLNGMNAMMGTNTVDHASQVYLTFEAYF